MLDIMWIFTTKGIHTQSRSIAQRVYSIVSDISNVNLQDSMFSDALVIYMDELPE